MGEGRNGEVVPGSMEDISRAVRVHRASASGRVLCANPQTKSRWSHLVGTCAILLSIIAGLAVSAASAGAAEPSQPRIYELVTPAKPTEKVNVSPVDVVGENGDEVVFQTVGNRETGPSDRLNTYLSTRAANGWQTKLLSPPAVYDEFYHPEYDNAPNDFFAFTPDLSKGIFATDGVSAVVEGEPPGSDNLYVQETATGAETLITPLAAGSRYEQPIVGATSADLSHVLFENRLDYFDTEECCRGGGESFVYDWSPEEGMTIASILPSGRLATDAGVGAGPLDQIDVEPSANAYSAFYGGSPHAISEDGERLFFTDPSPTGGTPIGHIYERRHQGKPDASTVQIDKPAPGTPESEAVRFGGYSSVFVAATPDGREVLFPSCVKLTPDSTAGESGPGWSCRTQWGNKYNAAFGATDFPAESDLYIYSEEG